MANYYIDPSAYTYAATPTWGVCQDGDGTAAAAATPSTASVVFTGVPSSGTIAVLGVTMSPTWATDADTCANNLATAINAATGTAVSPASFTTKSQVRNHVYARGPAGGAPAGTCEIMTRQGSAAHAGLVAVTHTLNNVSSAGTINFSGGSGGCWGWFTNPVATIWPSAIGINLYGVARGVLYTGTLPTTADFVYHRGNGGSITIDRAVSANMPAFALSTNYVFDDGTIWSGDAFGYTINLLCQGAGMANFTLDNASGRHVTLTGLSMGALKFSVSGTSTPSAICSVLVCNAAGQRVLANNIDFVEEAALGTGTMSMGAAASNSSNVYRRCRFTYNRSAFYSPFQPSNYGNQGLLIDGCEFTWVNFSGTPGALIAAASVTSGGCVFEVVDTKATTINPGLQPFTLPTNLANSTGATVARARNLTGFTLPTTVYGLVGGATGTNGVLDQALSSVCVQGIGPKRHFRYESNAMVLEWLSGEGWPTLNALLPDGSPWVYKMLWSNSAVAIRVQQPQEVICLTKTVVLADGVRTVEMELMLDDAYDAVTTYNDFQLQISYVAANGSGTKFETTPIYTHNAAALPASSQTWTNYTGSFNGTHVPRKLSLTTTLAVDQNSEIEARLVVMRPAPATHSIFINPELTIT